MAFRRAGRVHPFVPLMLLLAVLALRGATDWRYFDRFLGDHGWYLRVAERTGAGESLYQDVAWDYGPLPIYVLAGLFQVTGSLAWAKVADLLLAGLAVGAVYSLCRRLLGHREGVAIAAWAALLGSAEGLISYQLNAYTNAVAWGAAASLLTAVTASAWVAGGSSAHLVAASLLAAASVLSKPEFGLAALGVLAVACLVRRPTRRFWAGAGRAAGLTVTLIVARSSASTLFAWWRGYSGYDLVRIGQVPIASLTGMLGGLIVSAALVLAVWSRAGRLVVITGAVAVLLGRWISGETAPPLGLVAGGAEAAWAGTVPSLAWLAWRERGSALAPEFWVICAYATGVSLRLFLHGWPCAAAAGPTAALVWYLMRQGRVPRPSAAGLAVVTLVAIVLPLRGEIVSISRARRSEPVATRLGDVRIPRTMAAEIDDLRPHLDEAPPGPLFVLGGGAGWYLVSDRRNPTAFDVVWNGIGTTDPEAARILADLRAAPPAVVIVERDFDGSPLLSLERVWAAIGATFELRARTRSGRWDLYALDREVGVPRPVLEGLVGEQHPVAEP